MNPERGNPPAVHRHHFHLSPRNWYPISHPRQASQLRERVSAQCSPVTFWYLHAVIGAHIDERHGSSQLEHAIRDHGFTRGEIVLVGNVADDFFHEVFHGDDARGATVFI